jgi:hypothetical protein
MVLGIISPQNYFCASFMQSALSSFVLFCLTIWTWYLSTNLAFPHHFTTQAKQRTSLHEPYPKWFKVPLTYNYLIELIVIVRDIYKAHLSKQVLGYCDMGPRDSHLTITFFFSFFFLFFFDMSCKREERRFELVTSALWGVISSRLSYHLRTHLTITLTSRSQFYAQYGNILNFQKSIYLLQWDVFNSYLASFRALNVTLVSFIYTHDAFAHLMSIFCFVTFNDVYGATSFKKF